LRYNIQALQSSHFKIISSASTSFVPDFTFHVPLHFQMGHSCTGFHNSDANARGVHHHPSFLRRAAVPGPLLALCLRGHSARLGSKTVPLHRPALRAARPCRASHSAFPDARRRSVGAVCEAFPRPEFAISARGESY
jgi:hypothetical protein